MKNQTSLNQPAENLAMKRGVIPTNDATNEISLYIKQIRSIEAQKYECIGAAAAKTLEGGVHTSVTSYEDFEQLVKYYTLPKQFPSGDPRATMPKGLIGIDFYTDGKDNQLRETTLEMVNLEKLCEGDKESMNLFTQENNETPTHLLITKKEVEKDPYLKEFLEEAPKIDTEEYAVSYGTGKHISKRKIKRITKKLEEISEEESRKYKCIGTPLGMEELFPNSLFSGIEHCVYLGLVHGNNFEKKAKYYVRRDPNNLPLNDERNKIIFAISPTLPKWKKLVVVDFYGNKK